MLNKKLFRDIKQNLSQFITIFLMVLIGVTAYAGIEAYMAGMQKTADTFYNENNLQDLNVIGLNFTDEDIDKIKHMNDVNNVERKLSVTGSTDNDKTLLLNFIESNEISKFYIISGEEFLSNKSGVWLDEFYANKNDIKVGDIITITYDGYTFKEKVLALVNIPDHIYDTKDEGTIFPDRKEFGFAYLSSNELERYIKHETMEKLKVDEETLNKINFNYKDELIFNTIMVDVNSKDNVNSVKDEIEEEISSAKAILKIEDTASYNTYQGEIDEGKTYVGVFSGLFIFIAMLSVITTMTRVVKKQKLQIGILKALGFKDRKITMHYINYGLYISLIAAILGLILGYFAIGNFFIGLEMSLFEIPNGKPLMELSSYICALLVVFCVCLVTYLACRTVLKEKPADTLRNEIPKVKQGSLNITTKGFIRKLNFSNKWNIRDMFRNKFRTITGIVGIAGCCALIVCAFGMLDSINYFIKLQFDDLYNFNYKLNIKENTSTEDLNLLIDNYGNNTSKSYLIEYVNQSNEKISNNIFITNANDYVRFINKHENYIDINNNDGVFITEKLAKTNNYQIGDTIKWHMIGDNDYYESKIVGFNKDPQNQNITMTKDYYGSLGNTYIPDSIYTNDDLSNTTSIKNIDIIQDKVKLKEGMNNMLSMMKSMVVLLIALAILLGSVIIYNMGVLSYSEKEYQFATLKVLGFKDKKIRKIFIKQNSIISIISIIIGLPLGFYLTDYLFKVAIEESYDFGAYITVPTYIIASLGTIIISYLVSRILSKKINKLDMVSSLKGNE